MGKATLTSSIAVAKMQEYKRSMSGISQGMVVKRTWEPLRSHWTVTGKDTRKEDREAYAAIPSQYSK